MNIFRPSHIVFVTIKLGLLYILQDSALENSIKQIPFFNTKFTDYSRVQEAFYFIGQNQDPYQVEHIFQKPFMVYGLYYLKNIPGAITVLFVLFDLLLAELVSNLEFSHSKKKDLQTRQKISNFIRYAYHLNPLSFFAIITKWTSIFEYTFGLLAVYLFAKNNRFLGSLFYGVSLYLNPTMIMLIVPLVCSSFLNKQKAALSVFSIVVSFSVFVALLFASYILLGSLNFFKNAYISAYHVKLFQPSIGLMWSIFSGMFNSYQNMYHMIYFFLPLCHIFPLVQISYKAIKDNQFTSGLYGFIAGVSLFVGYYHFSFITVYDLIIIFTLLFTAYEYIVEIKVFAVLFYAPLVVLGLTSMLGIYWFYGLTGNPNFMFIQTMVAYVFLIIMVTEALKSLCFQKKNELKELKDQEEKSKNDQINLAEKKNN
ncbi:GPI transamidase subunit PIG-U (macronuclear) [Tetrahymena thermophila SB210]|uniref:GPI transamidase subunit PIG-U n=1 Tax=Tetrahymena thermophila (strain SB210) TaxID=312017 RepID=W7XE35_TETTS|nr:GPI transamidase subunit PIG-U [Tetrahymena thermophila SB210]EWS71124.1 GPI transamidase subunit PIG-U [Tetrahymena thermophila SB210]|eukprot:XP_012656332.1 GPI transamidase subunit PIG-U [Tetrahymena thermophila SB210]